MLFGPEPVKSCYAACCRCDSSAISIKRSTLKAPALSTRQTIQEVSTFSDRTDRAYSREQDFPLALLTPPREYKISHGRMQARMLAFCRGCDERVKKNSRSVRAVSSASATFFATICILHRTSSRIHVSHQFGNHWSIVTARSSNALTMWGGCLAGHGSRAINILCLSTIASLRSHFL